MTEHQTRSQAVARIADRTASQPLTIYSVSQKKFPLRGPDVFHFFHKRLGIFKQFFTHLLHVPIYARLQIFIQLSPILTKLCHIKRDYPVHIICSKCPPSAETHVFRRLRKSLITLLIVDCASHYKINTFIMSSNVWYDMMSTVMSFAQ